MSCRCWIAFICKQSSSSVSCCSLLPRENKGTICEAKESSSTRKTYSCKFTLTGFYNYMFSCIKAMIGWDSAQDSTQCDDCVYCTFVLMWIWTKTKAEERKGKKRSLRLNCFLCLLVCNLTPPPPLCKQLHVFWIYRKYESCRIWVHFTLQYYVHPPEGAVMTGSLEQDIYLYSL